MYILFGRFLLAAFYILKYITNQHDSSGGTLCCGVQHICVVAFLHLDVLQPGDHELMTLSIVSESGVNYIITNIPDENSISALQIINLDRSFGLLCLWVEELGHSKGARRRHERASDQ